MGKIKEIIKTLFFLTACTIGYFFDSETRANWRLVGLWKAIIKAHLK